MVELEIIEESRLEKTKIKDGARAESKKFQYKAEDISGDIAATFKCARRMFSVGDEIEFDISAKQEKLDEGEMVSGRKVLKAEKRK